MISYLFLRKQHEKMDLIFLVEFQKNHIESKLNLATLS